MQHQDGAFTYIQVQTNVTATLFAVEEAAAFFLAFGLVEAVAAAGLSADEGAAEEAEGGVVKGAVSGGAAPGHGDSVEGIVGLGEGDEFVDAWVGEGEGGWR